jgi:hypothetical protein
LDGILQGSSSLLIDLQAIAGSSRADNPLHHFQIT